MNKRTHSAELRSALLSLVSLRLEELFIDSWVDAGIYGELRRSLYKLDFLVVVTYDQWSKWPYKRTPVSFTTDALYDSVERSRIVNIVAEQIVALLLREMSEGSALVLLHLEKQHLLSALKRFYVNELTGDAVAGQMLQTAINRSMEELGVLTEEQLSEMLGTVG
jgi:hypothetical protein